MRTEPTCEQAIRANRELRAKAIDLERRMRAAQMRSATAERKLLAATDSPWVELPWYGRVPRVVGPGDPLRKLASTREQKRTP